MYKVKISKILCLWVLSIESDIQVYYAYTASRYIDCLDIARTLQLNIDIDQTKEILK